MKKIVLKLLKILAWLVGSIVILLILVLILIQVPAVQQFAKKKIVVFLEKKLQTKVAIGRLDINFPKRIVLENIYFEDQRKDTLLYGDTIRVDIALLKLLKNEVELNHLELNGIRANIYRLSPDTVFNFDYIVKAFGSEQKTEKVSTDTSSMKFSIGDIVLKNIGGRFHDDVSGNDARFHLASFQTRIKEFDPAHMVFSIPDIQLHGINASVRQYKPLVILNPLPVVSPDTAASSPIFLTLGKIDLSKIVFDYDNEVNALSADLNLGNLALVSERIDLQKMWMRLRQFELNNTTASVHMGKAAPVIKGKQALQQPGEKDTAQALPWRVELEELSLANNNIKFDDDNSAAIKKGMDYSHLAIDQLNISANQLLLSSDAYQGNIRQVSLREKSGFVLKELKAAFAYNDKKAEIKNLVLKTEASEINNNLLATYDSITQFSKQPGEVEIKLDLPNTHIAVSDVVTLVPALEPQLRSYNGSALNLDAAAGGRLNNITIAKLNASGLGKTVLQASGNIKGLPDAEKAFYDLRLQRFATTARDINAVAPRNTLPSNIRIPEAIELKGAFKGTMSNFNAALNGKTTRGGMNVMAVLKGKGKAYDIKAALDKVDLGYILKQEKNVGRISITADAAGSGFDYKTMSANANVKLAEGNVKGYTYRNLILNAQAERGSMTLKSFMEDPNLSFRLDATADVKPQYPAVQLMLQLDTLDLHALKLMKDTLQAHGIINADFASTHPDSLIGKLDIYDLAATHNKQRYKSDTLSLKAEQQNGTGTLALNSEMADVKLEGRYKLTEMATALQHTINNYYKLPSYKDTAFTPQQWSLDVLLRPSPLVLQFVPALKGTDTVGARMTFNSEANDLQLALNAPTVKYGTQAVTGLKLAANTEAEQLRYSVGAKNVNLGSMQLYSPSVNGKLADNKLAATVLLKDVQQKDFYRIGAVVEQLPDGIKANLMPDSLLLNYQKWDVTADNFVQYDSSGVMVNNLRISRNNQSLYVNSTQQTPNAPIEATFENFRIKTLTDFVKTDSLALDGTINGKAVARDVTTNPVFTSDIAIQNFTYNRDTVGNIIVKVDNETANAFNANVKIEGNGNDVQLQGKYFTGESRMDLKLDVNNLNLASIRPLTAGQLLDAKGSLVGNATVSGTIDQPSVNGELRFRQAELTPAITGEPIRLNNEVISLSNQGIRFNNFTIIDSANNKATINGDILTQNFKDYKFQVDLRANDFRVVNAPQAPDRLFYGKLNIDTDVELRGDMNAPVVNGSVRVNKETNFSLVLPTADPEVEDRLGVVNFIDKDHPTDTLVTASALDSLSDQTPFRGMDVNMNIETDSAAVFTMVVDERNGDALTVQGRADLAASIDQSGKISLTGNYELERGAYQLSLSVLKRKFEIEKGSTITWTGDPTSAQVNITAVYISNTPSIDLVAPQLVGREPVEVNRFKEKLPFRILLMMKGELLKPEISFDIQLPQEELSQWPEVESRLQQVRNDASELNKQVFAVLLLNRFVQEDPLKSDAAGTNIGLMAKQSAGKILSDQLNQITNNLVKGVELNFDLNSEQDFTTGTQQERTELNVGVSKKLLNDRLRVNVGSNFELENTDPNTNRETTNIAGDVSVDYQLSKDGRYMLRAYRTNKYEAVVEGQVIETGLSFILTYDYNRFKELFKGKRTRDGRRRAPRKNTAPRNEGNNNNNQAPANKQAADSTSGNKPSATPADSTSGNNKPSAVNFAPITDKPVAEDKAAFMNDAAKNDTPALNNEPAAISAAPTNVKDEKNR
ncbi:translocation/assembly module TamB domain-containing protein [Filimonas effusa]|uniref:Translocation/assembly module TamB n=1 Tax=Filimonas effusa TaxID=2508721 RepID=A0A4V1M9H9_9BACT|nr:translocation/assembly module TamB domain-containing protein [Filimonas effusa]RXK81208.1 translocation/assembly module TamB [Filimonas effusa]